jgi:hypothetical protein
VQRRSLVIIGEAATRWSQYHPGVGIASGYQGWTGVTRKMGSPARELVEHRDRVSTVDEKVDGKRVGTPRVNLIHRQSSRRRPSELVWKRKVGEYGSSTGAGHGRTVLIGSVPCRL